MKSNLEESYEVGFRLHPGNTIYVSADGGEEELMTRDEFIELIEPWLINSDIRAYRIFCKIKVILSENSSQYYILNRYDGTLQAYNYNPPDNECESMTTSQPVASALNAAISSIVSSAGRSFH